MLIFLDIHLIQSFTVYTRSHRATVSDRITLSGHPQLEQYTRVQVLTNRNYYRDKNSSIFDERCIVQGNAF